MAQSVLFKDNPSWKNIIELKNISQSYDGGKNYIIKDLNLLIEDKPKQGQFVVILGPSGCGKSTILRYISGLQKPTSGEILFFEKPLSESDRIGMVFQKYSSFPWLNVLDNVELGLKIKGLSKQDRKEKAWEMLKLVELEDHAGKYCQYPTLSGGQLQRVAIARSLLANPEIMLMDEPFGALDIKTRLKMQDLIQKIWGELSAEDECTTVMLVTHDIAEAVYLADDIVIMGGKPANIIDMIHVDLPLVRSRETKRTPYFKDMVAMIEDKMMALEK